MDTSHLILINKNDSTYLNLYKLSENDFTMDLVLKEEDQLKFEVEHLNRKNKYLQLPFRYNYDSIKKKFDSIDESMEPIQEIRNLRTKNL